MKAREGVDDTLAVHTADLISSGFRAAANARTQSGDAGAVFTKRLGGLCLFADDIRHELDEHAKTLR